MYEEILDKHEQFKNKVYECQRQITEQADRPMRIAVCGKFKSGKTSLINQLLGLNLPVQAITATRLITQIERGVYSYRQMADKTRRIISENERNRLILNEKGMADKQTERIVVGCNSAVLGDRTLEIWDTPGLEDTAELTEISMQAMKQCDFAVLVFDANKFGSWYEKMTLETLQEILGGNVIFVINRVDLLNSREDLEHVKKSAEYLLGDYGNALIGQGRILYTSASPTEPDIEALRTYISALVKDRKMRRLLCRNAQQSHLRCMLREWMELLTGDLQTVKRALAEEEKKAERERDIEYQNIRQKKKEVAAEINKLWLLCMSDLREEWNWFGCLHTIEKKPEIYKNYYIYAEKALRAGLEKFHVSLTEHLRTTLKKEADITWKNLLIEPDVDSLFQKMTYPVFKENNSSMAAGATAGAVAGSLIPGIGILLGGAVGFVAGVWHAVNQDDRAIEEFERVKIPSVVDSFQNIVVPGVEQQYKEGFDALLGRIEKAFKRREKALQGKSSRRLEQLQEVTDKLENIYLAYARRAMP
ncbi:MAG: dynamin family protein [Eubacteriales bacterium]|nr:dynamin family protein [Eubacteriales bacterium]